MLKAFYAALHVDDIKQERHYFVPVNKKAGVKQTNGKHSDNVLITDTGKRLCDRQGKKGVRKGTLTSPHCTCSSFDVFCVY